LADYVKPLFFCPHGRPQGRRASLVKTILRLFFHLLYHQFAFTYDLVAAVVSLNRWKDWVLNVIPFIEGVRVLEIGYGPGHLQRSLLTLRHVAPRPIGQSHSQDTALRHGSGQVRNLVAVGIDESAQMGQLAKRNLRRRGFFHSQTNSSQQPDSPRSSAYTQASLTRGIAQQLPFPNESFDTIVATFPAKYIFDPATLAEVWRTLVPGGRFIILPGAIITGRSLLERFMAWIFRVTGETPPNLPEILHERSREPFAKAGFHVETHEIAVKSSLVFIVLATKNHIKEETKYV